MWRQIIYNMKVIAFLIIKWEEFPVLIDLIGLITPSDFNQLSIDLKLAFKISADSQHIFLLEWITVLFRIL